MISRFSQLSLAFTTVTPLFLSIAMVIIFPIFPAYMGEWKNLFFHGIITCSVSWWTSTIFILLFVYSWVWTGWFLGRLKKQKSGTRTITLSSLQYQPICDLLPMVSLLPPWLSLLSRNEVMIVIIVIITIVALIITYCMSRQGYSSLVFLLCGYLRYEGQDRNGMKIQLLSRRTWRNYRDIRTIYLLSDNFALVI